MTARQRIAALCVLTAVLIPAAGFAQTTRPGVDTERVDSGAPLENERVGGEAESDLWPWARTLLALGLVVGLIFALRFVLKRLGGPAALRAAGPVEILLRANLSAKERIYLVRMGGRLLLLGSGAGGLTTLCDVREQEEAARLISQARGGPARKEDSE